jgi:hypothetical protein
MRPGVLLDWDLFQRLSRRGRDRGTAGTADLHRALDLVRGQPFEAVPTSRYRWVAELYIEHDIAAAVIDTAHMLARRLLDADAPAGARRAARTAQLVDRYDERPWRDLMEAEHLAGRPIPTRHVAGHAQWEAPAGGIHTVTGTPFTVYGPPVAVRWPAGPPSDRSR